MRFRVLKPAHHFAPFIFGMTLLTFSSVTPILALVRSRCPYPLKRTFHYSAVFLAARETEEKEQVQLVSPWTPWNHPSMVQRAVSKRASRNKNRCRQHVNPLASQFQKQTVLPDDWPHSDFIDPSKPLHVDVGCGKGGFLFEFAAASASSRDDRESTETYPYNHLGLEIRPPVVQLAKSRLGTLQGHVDIIGCNANVDLDRILSLYPGPLELVSIQFPDPHFKSQHAKRRVVRQELVQCIARHLDEDGIVFLQSDIQTVLDDMRLRFAECDEYFIDSHHPGEYIADNQFGVPTEREVSVLERGLPVYRALFRRNDRRFEPKLLQQTA